MTVESDLELKVSYSRLKASTQALTLKAFTEINSLNAFVEVGVFPYVPFLIEPTDLLDFTSNANLLVEKNFNNSINLTQDLSFDFELNKEDINTAQESIEKSFEKSFANSYTASESASIEALKSFENSATFEFEDVTLQTEKNLSSSVLLEQNINLVFKIEKNLFSSVFVTDDVDGAASIEDDQEIFFTKQKRDLAYALEEPYLEIEKYLTSSSIATQEVEYFELVKGFSNIVNSIESLNTQVEKPLEEEAVSNESVEKVFEKILKHSSNFEDTIQFELTKPLADETLFNDSEVLTVTKALISASIASEDSVFEFEKLLQNTSSVNEGLFLQIEKTLSDIYSVLENSSFIFEKNLQDSATLADTIGTIALDKLLSDSFTLEEVSSFTFVKDLNSLIFATDDLDGETSIDDDQEITFTKALTNIARASEKRDFTLEKTLFTELTSIEQIANTLEKPQLDSFDTTDFAQLNTEKNLVNYFFAQEISDLSFTKAAEDTFESSDTSTLDFGKNLNSPTLFTDEPFFTTEKQLFSSITATDDIDGEASILDDSEIIFTKQKTNVLFLSDSNQIFYIEKSLADNPLAAENLAKSFQKSLNSSVEVSENLEDFFIRGITQESASGVEESSSWEFTKALSNESNFTDDNLFLSTEKAITNFANAQESTVVNFEKILQNNASWNEELLSFEVEKNLTSNSTVSENTTFENQKNLFDTFFATDDIDGESSVLDDQEIVFTKQRTNLIFSSEDSILFNTKALTSELASVADLVHIVLAIGRTPEEFLNVFSEAALTFQKTKTDSFSADDESNLETVLNQTDVINTSSSGSLVSQGYTVDNTYFLEDYVGYSRLFT